MKKLFLFDMDSTLINEEVIDLIAAKAGKANQVREITERAMAGFLDFEGSLRERVSLLQGLPIEILDAVRKEITLTKGAKDLLNQIADKGHVAAVVSGGFLEVIAPFLEDLGINYYRANRLEVSNAKLTGALLGEVIDRKAKALALKEFATAESISYENTIAIGDGANDIDMIKESGFGIAFCAKEALVQEADCSIINRDLLEVLNYVAL